MFNLEEYETIQQRIKRFRAEFISGRIETSIVQIDLAAGAVLIEARVYREHEDTAPAAIDYAYGNQAFYNQNMKRWFVEDTSSSAIGRAISLLTPGEHRSTAETMSQVVQEKVIDSSDPWASVTITTSPAEGSAETLGNALNLVQSSLGGVMVDEEPTCEHGRMQFKKGISKTTGNAYSGYVCNSPTKPQCPPKWDKN